MMIWTITISLFASAFLADPLPQPLTVPHPSANKPACIKDSQGISPGSVVEQQHPYMEQDLNFMNKCKPIFQECESNEECYTNYCDLNFLQVCLPEQKAVVSRGKENDEDDAVEL